MPLIDRDAEYDVIVIGAGSTGENVAGRAVKGGLTCAVVENELVGVTAPTGVHAEQGAARSGQVLRAALAVDGARQAVTGTIDSAAVLRRRDSFTSQWKDDSQVRWLEDHHIDLARGTGRLAGERRVIVTPAEAPSSRSRPPRGRALHRKPRIDPSHPGHRSAGVWTSRRPPAPRPSRAVWSSSEAASSPARWRMRGAPWGRGGDPRRS